MTKSAIKKYSVLGLAILSTSAIIAAIQSKKTNKKPLKDYGRLIFDVSMTCKPDGFDCDYSATYDIISTTTDFLETTSKTMGPNYSSHGVNTTGI